MGRSVTYHIIGLSRENEHGRNCYPAMNRLEMRQAMRKARIDEDCIEFWYAQTFTGCRILRVADTYDWTPTPQFLMKIKVIPCPVCGHRPRQEQGCGICRFSGITTEKVIKKYAPWQLEPLSENVSGAV
jgi:hypothetical protein